MTVFWKTCRDCNGRGEVAPSNNAARIPARMTGTIINYTWCVCATCAGTGMKWKNTAKPE